MSKLNRLIENDGFIYCIRTNLKYNNKHIVKIGKTKFGNKTSKTQVENHIMQILIEKLVQLRKELIKK